MGRMEAIGKVDRKTGEVKRAGKVSEAMMNEWVTRAGIELRGAGVDESPHCYKRLTDVLHEHANSIRVLHTLAPVGVGMAGKGGGLVSSSFMNACSAACFPSTWISTPASALITQPERPWGRASR